MELRKYGSKDLPVLAELFRETILTVNRRDYTEEQTKAWASRWQNLLKRDGEFQRMFTLVAYEQGTLLGFGNISKEGYLDLLYVHKDHQGQGVATALCDKLEQYVEGDITVNASVTARPFFEKRGYVVLKENLVDVDGVSMKNFTMQKRKERSER
ncbi:MAG: GNAT family N-acetyltransferase [Negativibacillus sp.]